MVPGGGNGLLALERVLEYRGEYIAKFDVNVSRNVTRYTIPNLTGSCALFSTGEY
jgi:hypothetical protein